MARRRAFVTLLFVATAAFGPLLLSSQVGAASGRVGVVVRHHDGSQEVECVRFAGTQIRALTALDKTRFDLYTQNFGGSLGRATCWLDGEGYEPSGPGCFGGLSDPSWGVWFRKPGQTQPRPSDVGISTLVLPNGSLLHMQFDEFDPPDFVQPTPPKVRIGAVCS